jgi:hypothetical protein
LPPNSLAGKKAAPEGAAKFREETPRTGSRHKQREVSHTALQQYGPRQGLPQAQLLNQIRIKTEHFSQFSPAFWATHPYPQVMLRCKKATQIGRI